MSVFFKAKSGKFSSSVGILIIRLSLGSLFLFAGAGKLLNLQAFITSVQEMGQMNDNIAFILAFVLPFMQMIFGAMYIIGLFTPVTSFFIAVMSFSFLIVLGIGHPELPYSYNFVFLACGIATMFMGAGLISFDALIDKEKPESERNINVTPPTVIVRDTSSTPMKNENYADEKEVIVTVEESNIKENSGENSGGNN
ncbi:MAG TPA: DoxX family protein [Ignavibacteria bacterium]|nr:DoxX family protein [Ignavibacteria bacterium]HQY52846.1 DoxX family protein [Ignavibacteria bacterium]HRB00287.1 DoxX family protein [Ignavibacteria bacterium]